jgi:hypothetical protein
MTLYVWAWTSRRSRRNAGAASPSHGRPTAAAKLLAPTMTTCCGRDRRPARRRWRGADAGPHVRRTPPARSAWRRTTARAPAHLAYRPGRPVAATSGCRRARRSAQDHTVLGGRIRNARRRAVADRMGLRGAVPTVGRATQAALMTHPVALGGPPGSPSQRPVYIHGPCALRTSAPATGRDGGDLVSERMGDLPAGERQEAPAWPSGPMEIGGVSGVGLLIADGDRPGLNR